MSYHLQPARIRLAVLGALAFFTSHTAGAQTAPVESSPAPAGETMSTVVISADASAAGLPKAYSGGQTARGGRVGMFGNMDNLDTPFSSTNFTQQFIEDQQAHSVADVLQSDPGVRVARGFGNYQELYVIRGFPLASDDLAYNGLYSVLPRQYIAAELLERVEVFRGANSFLNGAAPGGSGIGGSVNLLPKRAPNAPLTQLTVGEQTGSQSYFAADIARRFGPDNRAGVRINAVHRKGGTGIDDEDRALDMAVIGLDYRGRSWRLSADLGWQDTRLRNSRPAVNVATAIAIPAAPDASTNFGQPWDFSSERDVFGTLRGEWDIAPDLLAWASFGGRRGTESNRLASTLNVTSATGAANIRRFDNTRQDGIATGEIGLRGSLRTGPVSHQLSVTASAFNLNSRNAYATSAYQNSSLYDTAVLALPAFNAFGNSLDSPRTTNRTTLHSTAVADNLGFFEERLLVTVGARRQTIVQNGYAYNTGKQNAHYDDSAWTPMAGVVYKFTPAVSAYANYVESLVQGAVAGSTAVNVGEIFAPYKSKQKEIGLKYDTGRYGATAALFTTKQPQGILDPATRVFGIDGEQRNRGIELSVFGQPVTGLRVLGGVTVLDAKQEHTAGGLTDGRDVIGVPKSQTNLGLDWDVPGVRGLSVSGRALYTATQAVNAANTQTLPAWNRLDASARYQFDLDGRSITLRARVDNLADRRYWASAGGSQGTGYLVLGAPRTFAMTATAEF